MGRSIGILVVTFFIVGAGGCGGARLSAPTGEPVADPAAFAASLRETSVPPEPLQYNFGWTLDEQGSVVRGRGAVRTQNADRIRLDLFGSRGDTYLVAALVDDEYRLPPSAENAGALPSPSLLWAALGILNPPPGAVISSATTEDDLAELRYQLPNDEIFAYTFRRAADDRFRLVSLERAERRGVLETVTVTYGADGNIARTRYRDWAAFRELDLTVEGVRARPPFPMNIWSPDEVSR